MKVLEFMRRVSVFSTLFFAACLITGVAAARAEDDPPPEIRQAFESGKYPAAMATLRAEIARNSQDAKAHYWLSRCSYELREYDDAIAQGELAIKFDPRNPVYHFRLGRAYEEKADRERSFFAGRKVKSELEEAVKLNPKYIAARRDLAQFYIEAPWIVGGSKDQARAQVDAIAALDPIEGHLARADSWMSQKRADAAEGEYRLVIQAKPNRPEPYFEVAEFYQRQGKAMELKAAVDEAAKLRPSDPRLSYFRGVERVLAGADSAEAEQYLKSYLATTPERSDWPSHGSAREWLGMLYEKEGKRMQAAEQYRAVLQVDPGRKSARDKLARLEKGSK